MQERALEAQHKSFPYANSASLNILNNIFTWDFYHREFPKCCV